MPGNGPLLGRPTALALRAGQRARIWIPLTRRALVRAPWTTTGRFRATSARTLLALALPAGTPRVLIRDGRVKASIQRIRHGTRRALKPIL